MATLIWIGGTSTDSATLANWKDQSTGSAPTSIAISDDFLFNDEATADCLLNQTQIGTITVLGDAFSPRTLIYNSTTLTIDSIRYTGATKIKFAQSTTTITFTGTHSTSTPQFGHPILVEGSIAYDATGNGKETCLLKLKNTGGSASFFTNGDLSKIQIVSGIFTTNPSSNITGTHGKLETPFLQIDNGTTFSNSDIGLNDTQKHIQVTGLNQSTQYFKCAAEILDFSNAKLTIDARSPAGTVIQHLPCTNDETNYGTGGEFIALLEDVVVGNNSGNGHQIGIPAGLTLHCDTLEIQSGSMLLGGGTTQTASKSNINCIGKITIRGTWNFEETSDGIYSSIGGTTSQSKYKLTANNVHILDKLTVDGLIDPTGMEFTAVGSNPGTDAAKTIWVNSGDSNKLYFGSSEVGSGGGGGGTVDVVSNVATNTILGRNDAGSGDSEELTPAEVRTMLNVEDGATADQTGAEIKAAYEAEANTNAFTDALLTKLNGIEASADANVGLQYARWYGKNTGSDLYTLSSGARQYLDLADTSKFGESSTGTHSSITLVNASTDYITLTAGGIYQIVISLESFPSSTVSVHDRWVEVNTNSSANRALGTARMQTTGSSNGNWNAQKTVVHEIPSTGSDVDVYISFLTNGTGASIRAYDDNRISVAITRLGDASV